MVHGDDSGLVLPPKIAPTQAMIIPIAMQKEGVLDAATNLYKRLQEAEIRIKIDKSDKTPGFKFAEQEMLGIPIRIEIGPKDIENNQAVIVKRNNREKITVSLEDLETKVKEILEDIQKEMYQSAKEFLDSHIKEAKTMEEMKEIATNEIGFIKAMWCGSAECEEEIKSATGGYGSRCIPEEQKQISKKCIHCGKEAKHMVIWGKSY